MSLVKGLFNTMFLVETKTVMCSGFYLIRISDLLLKTKIFIFLN